MHKSLQTHCSFSSTSTVHCNYYSLRTTEKGGDTAAICQIKEPSISDAFPLMTKLQIMGVLNLAQGKKGCKKKDFPVKKRISCGYKTEENYRAGWKGSGGLAATMVLTSVASPQKCIGDKKLPYPICPHVRTHFT